MKPALLLPLLLCSCTSLDAQRGTYYTNADNLGVKIDFYPTGRMKHYEVASNEHSPLIDAYGRLIGSIGAAAAEALIAHGAAVAVMHGVSNGVQLLTAAVPPTVHHAVTRPTNRPTPKP